MLTKIIKGIQTFFRQHQWEDARTHDMSGYIFTVARCRRCGDTLPWALEHVKTSWWQGGCGGEHELIRREVQKWQQHT